MAKKAIVKNQRSAREGDVHIGVKIRMRRIEVGMSQDTLGKELGLTFQQVQKYEKGVNRVSATRLQQIAKALDTDLAFFMTPTEGGGASQMMTMITDTASQRLLRAFHKIEDMPTRYKVVGLLEAITSHAA